MSIAPGVDAAAGPPERGQAAVETAQGWRRLSLLGIVPLALRSLRQAIVPTIAVIYGSSTVADAEPLGLPLGLLAAAGIVMVTVVFTALGWWRTQYRIGPDDIRLHRGVLGHQARSVPLERIQDVSLEQGPLARLLGLVEVRFETGAGGKDELALAYVTRSEGEALRETVRTRLDAQSPATSEDAAGTAAGRTAAPAGPALFVMNPRRLLLFGLFEFSLVVFAVLGGAAQQFDFLLPFDIWEFSEWQRRLAGSDAMVGAWFAGLDLAARVAGALLALVALAAVGLATGVVRTVLRDFGFRLERTAKGFRRRRGLLTRTDVVMPVHRVQALTLSTGPIRRWWGWHGLAFVSLAQDAGSAHHVVAPFARLAELAPIAAAAGLPLPGPDTQWLRPNPRYRIDRAGLALTIPTLLTLLALALGLLPPALLALALGLVLGLRQYALWRCERYAQDGDRLLGRTGWLGPRITVAAPVKLHSVEILQGPLGRRHGYADLALGLAGGRLRLDGLPVGDARRLRSAILEAITAVDFSQLPR